MNPKSFFRKVDMTHGPIMRNVLLFAFPLIVGNILQYLYTTVDTLVIGTYCGTTSLAAVGTSAQPVEVLLCIFLGIGTGVSILVSQYTGANNWQKTHALTRTAVSFIWACGIPVGVLGFFAAPAILHFMQVPEDAAGPAITYTQIVFAGTLGNIGYNMNAGILRGIGNSTASLVFLIISCITNIILDLVFVAGLGMDVGGAALATSISMYVSWLASIFYIRKHSPELRLPFFTMHFSGDELKRILSIGLPIGLNNSLYSFGHIALQSLVNSQGSVFMAGHTVAGRITGMSNIAISGMSSAATTFSGQNYGAKNYDRLRQGYKRIPFFAGLITLLAALACMTIRMPVLYVFTQDAEVLMYADRNVTTILLCQWCFAVFNTILCIVNGVGLVRFTTLINLLMLWAVRIPSAYLIRTFFDGTWIMLCFPISFAFGMFSMIGYYAFSKEWKRIISKGHNDMQEGALTNKHSDKKNPLLFYNARKGEKTI